MKLLPNTSAAPPRAQGPSFRLWGPRVARGQGLPAGAVGAVSDFSRSEVSWVPGAAGACRMQVRLHLPVTVVTSGAKGHYGSPDSETLQCHLAEQTPHSRLSIMQMVVNICLSFMRKWLSSDNVSNGRINARRHNAFTPFAEAPGRGGRGGPSAPGSQAAQPRPTRGAFV